MCCAEMKKSIEKFKSLSEILKPWFISSGIKDVEMNKDLPPLEYFVYSKNHGFVIDFNSYNEFRSTFAGMRGLKYIDVNFFNLTALKFATILRNNKIEIGINNKHESYILNKMLSKMKSSKNDKI